MKPNLIYPKFAVIADKLSPEKLFAYRSEPEKCKVVFRWVEGV